jgi:hypothetical protein
MMLPRRTDQLKFRWKADDATWETLPPDRRNVCRELLAQLLRAVTTDERTEGRTDDEREDHRCTS